MGKKDNTLMWIKGKVHVIETKEFVNKDTLAFSFYDQNASDPDIGIFMFVK